MLRYFRLLLFPFAFLYGLGVFIRNKCYDFGILKSTSFNLPVICIGNLVVGGAGKTPATEYLARLLADYKVAVLSRGYGRKTKGFILADVEATAETIGDEPLQYYHKFPNLTVAVCEDRVEGINRLKDSHEVIILDDAFQHRAVRAGFNLLLFDYASVRRTQFLLPMGNLREPWSAYRRAQGVLITKTPLPLNRMDQIEVRKRVDTEIDQRISFSSIRYGALEGVYTQGKGPDLEGRKVFLLTGIANTAPLVEYLEGCNCEIVPFHFPDHHMFTAVEISALKLAFTTDSTKEKIIVTTEKDSKRLLDVNLKDLLLNLPLYYLPIEMELAPKDKITFDQIILDYVASFRRIS